MKELPNIGRRHEIFGRGGRKRIRISHRPKPQAAQSIKKRS